MTENSIYYKKERFKAWWNQEVLDRPLISIFVKRKGTHFDFPEPGHPERPETVWLNLDYRIAKFRHRLLMTDFMGDAMPIFDCTQGPGSLAAYLGAKPRFAYNTVWYEPVFNDITKANIPALDFNNQYWRKTTEIARKSADKLRGEALLQFPDFIENLDILASLRGTQNLLMDLSEHKEHVHRLQRQILEAYIKCYNEVYEIIKDRDGGSYYWAYGTGRTAKVQCDLSAMISPEMFTEFVVPYLEEQASHIDNVLYHLDGPSAVMHLPCLLGIKRIKCIQWTPGAGEKQCGSKKWYGLYKRILDAGKSLFLYNLEPHEVKEIVKEFGPEGIFFMGVNVADKEEAEKLLKELS